MFSTLRDGIFILNSERLGGGVFVQGGVGTPYELLRELKEYVVEQDMKGITLHQFFPKGEMPIFGPECKGKIRLNSLFASKQLISSLLF